MKKEDKKVIVLKLPSTPQGPEDKYIQSIYPTGSTWTGD